MSHAPFAIRPLTPDDAELYSALRREMLVDSPHSFLGTLSDDNPMNPAWLRQRLSEPMNVIIGSWREDGSLAGVAGVYRETREKFSHRAVIWGVYVTPGARTGGVGRAVVSRALETARSWAGVRRVALAVSVRSEPARRLYESLGFRAWGTEPDAITLDGELIDEIHMSMALGVGH